MNKNLYLYSYNKASKASEHLAHYLSIQRIRHTNSRFLGDDTKTIINWGSSTLSNEIMKCRILNSPIDVFNVSNKLSFFEKLLNKKLTPLFTTSIEIANGWIDRGKVVVCRTLLNASNGRGIILASNREELIPAPLYVRYIPKQDEYRVHLFNGEIIDIQKKARKLDVPAPNWRIRNHNNGFVFIREGINPPKQVLDTAIEVFNEFAPLTFGAVDIIWVENKSRALALEINTAPGLEGQTVMSYGEVFKEYL